MRSCSVFSLNFSFDLIADFFYIVQEEKVNSKTLVILFLYWFIEYKVNLFGLLFFSLLLMIIKGKCDTN